MTDIIEKPWIKCVVVGHESSGKTNLLNVYQGHHFDETLDATIGIGFSEKTSDQAKILFYDCAGRDRYFVTTKSYLLGAGCVMICCDVTNSEGIPMIDSWLSAVPEKCPYLIVGTQIDKIDEENPRIICKEEIDLYIKKYPGKYLGYQECSAKTGENVQALFENYLKEVIDLKSQSRSSSDSHSDLSENTQLLTLEDQFMFLICLAGVGGAVALAGCLYFLICSLMLMVSATFVWPALATSIAWCMVIEGCVATAIGAIGAAVLSHCASDEVVDHHESESTCSF